MGHFFNMKPELISTTQEVKKFKEDSLESITNFRVAFFGASSEKSEHDKNAIEPAKESAAKIVENGQHKVINKTAIKISPFSTYFLIHLGLTRFGNHLSFWRERSPAKFWWGRATDRIS